MAIHYRTKGFVFKKTNRYEADQVFSIFTYDYGRLEILAKAIRKITSKLRGGLDLFYFSEVEFIQGKLQKTLTDANTIEKFQDIKKNLKKIKIAFKISEILDNFLRFEEKDEKVWKLILETFNRLNNLQSTICNLQFYYFLWNFFLILGYGPELYDCALCQQKLTPYNLFFSSKDGGIICQTCAKKVKMAEKIGSDVIKILRIIIKKDWQTLSKLKMNSPSLKALRAISENYYLYLFTEHSKTDKIDEG